jgi:hypothetical protein
MHRLIGYVTRAFAVLLLLTASAPTAPSHEEAPCGGADPARAEDPPPKCCFTNPGFAGTCEVQPAKEESCGQILDYLNNPMSQGKDYCSSTTVRGGWNSVACQGDLPDSERVQPLSPRG